jgi:uroporphyrinogen III methyltransferase/synthase
MADALVMALGEHAPEALSRVCVASIGPITSATLEKHGIVPTVTATNYTIEGLLDALEIYFKGIGTKGV